MHLIKRISWIGFIVLANLCVSQAFAGDAVIDALKQIEGLTVSEVQDPTTPVGYRRFDMELVQPTDHLAPQGETFSQKLVLLHRGFEEPMVLQTSGYSIFGVRLSAVAQTFRTNQIQVEHRFFAASKPASSDWSKLDIEQSAADFHHVAVAFKALYAKRWVNTGASKGGMTSIYHRRFYPQDLDGTVADVAPLSFSTSDARYVGFVDNAGGARFETCRGQLAALQVNAFKNRDQIIARLNTQRFTTLGGTAVSFEHAILELPFAFWQYQNPESLLVGCNTIPRDTASLDQVMNFIDSVNSFDSYADSDLAGFEPYYYQAGTQLGVPDLKRSHLAAFLKHPYSISQYMPRGITYSYSETAMRDVAAWVQDESKNMMFVYGEFDPWTAGAFAPPAGEDTHRFMVPGGNHSAKFTLLPASVKAQATAILSAWLDKAPAAQESDKAQPLETLEDLELAHRRRLHLP